MAPVPTLIPSPTVVAAAGNKPKRIEEFAGRVNSGHAAVSVARMTSPEGWREPGQRPAFEEITVVLSGLLRVEHEGGTIDVRAGQAVVAHPGEWVRYSTPEPGGAQYVAVCLPAFSPRDRAPRRARRDAAAELRTLDFIHQSQVIRHVIAGRCAHFLVASTRFGSTRQTASGVAASHSDFSPTAIAPPPGPEKTWTT